MVEDVRMECTDNGGFIVCYTEKVKPTGSNSELASYNYNYKKEAFGENEQSQALARMQELAKGMKDEETKKIEIEIK